LGFKIAHGGARQEGIGQEVGMERKGTKPMDSKNKPKVLIRAHDKCCVYGYLESLTLTYTISNEEGVDLHGLKVQCHTNANPDSPVTKAGYAISPSVVGPEELLRKLSDECQLVLEPGTLTLTAAPLVAVAENTSSVYGNPPQLSATASENRNGITATASSAAASDSAVGSYPSIVNLVDPCNKQNNYNVVKTNGTHTVAPAPLMVAVEDAVRSYGQPNPPFKAAITPNVDGICATPVSAAGPSSPAGQYPIDARVSDAKNKLGDYNLNKKPGILTVKKAQPRIIVPNSPAIVAGTSTTNLSGTIETDFDTSPTGHVAIAVNGTATNVSIQNRTFTGSLNTIMLPPGVHKFDVFYDGDDNHAPGERLRRHQCGGSSCSVTSRIRRGLRCADGSFQLLPERREGGDSDTLRRYQIFSVF
jgi:hypothetical protein